MRCKNCPEACLIFSDYCDIKHPRKINSRQRPSRSCIGGGSFSNWAANPGQKQAESRYGYWTLPPTPTILSLLSQFLLLLSFSLLTSSADPRGPRTMAGRNNNLVVKRLWGISYATSTLSECSPESSSMQNLA